MVKNPPANLGDVGSIPLMGKILWKRKWQLTPVFLGFPGGSDGRESACSAGDLGSVSGLGRSPGGGHGNPLQYSHLEHPHGQRSLVGHSAWGHKELDTTEGLSTAQHSTGPHCVIRKAL